MRLRVQSDLLRENSRQTEDTIEAGPVVAAKSIPSHFSPGNFLIFTSAHAGLTDLSQRLPAFGRYEEAIEATRKAITIRRENVNEDAFMRELGANLHRPGIYLCRVCRGEDAVGADEEAVTVLRKAPHDQNDLLALSCALRNLSAHQRALGREEKAVDSDSEALKIPTVAEAIKNGREAVELRRQLLEKDPLDTKLYGNAPNLLATSLTRAGCHEGVKIGTESANVIRKIAESNVSLLSGLIFIVHNVALNLWNLERFEDSPPFRLETVEVTRKILEQGATAKPSLELANYLSILSAALATLCRYEEALEKEEEAVAEYRAVARIDPTALPLLVTSLSSLSKRLSALNQYDKLVAAAEETVIIRRNLRGEQGAPALLAMDLAQLARVFHAAGKMTDAIAARQEEILLLRAVADGDLTSLASELYDLSLDLTDIADYKNATKTSGEAVSLHFELAKKDPTQIVWVSTALHRYAVNLASLERYEESVIAGKEAAEIFQLRIKEDPGHMPTLSMTLNNLGVHLSWLEQPKESIPYDREALDIRRKTAEADLTAAHMVAVSLSNLAFHLSEAEQYEEAVEARKEAVTLREEIAETDSSVLPCFARTIHRLTQNLAKLDRYDEAIYYGSMRVRVLKKLLKDNPSVIYQFADSLQ
ncbi:hypothetical protein FRB98_001609 [Tulasnella sp. 332]|nr:hypothetical protein FRB98_001609 [Tulasnella sp. 332]